MWAWMSTITSSWKMNGMKGVITGTGPVNTEKLCMTSPGLQRDVRGCQSTDASHPLQGCWLLVKWQLESTLQLCGLPSLPVVWGSGQKRRMPGPTARLRGGAAETAHRQRSYPVLSQNPPTAVAYAITTESACDCQVPQPSGALEASSVLMPSCVWWAQT